ncbi:MAG: chromate transporter [Bacillota bacterium]|nr:chromate transporter [Bacillota bacterium]
MKVKMLGGGIGTILKLIDLFMGFLKVGFLSFGGGYTFIPLIEHQAVEVYKWVTHEEFMKILGAQETIPGAISVKFATYIGYKEAGLSGAAAAVIGSFIVPVSGIIILFNLLKIFEKFSSVNRILKGFRSATWGLIIGLGVKSLVKTDISMENIMIGVCASVGIAVFNLSPGLIMILAGILGLLFYK